MSPIARTQAQRHRPSSSVSHTNFLLNSTLSFRPGITLVGIKVLNHVLNAIILLFTISAANSDLYIGSRTLYGLAVEGKAPSIFTKVDKRGLPWVAVLVVSIFTTLTFLNVQSSSATGERAIQLGQLTQLMMYGPETSFRIRG